MLVLGRRKDQSVIIITGSGEKIRIVVDRKVKLGFTAKKNISILREEMVNGTSDDK